MPSQLLPEHRKLRTHLKKDINKQVHKRSVLIFLIKYLIKSYLNLLSWARYKQGSVYALQIWIQCWNQIQNQTMRKEAINKHVHRKKRKSQLCRIKSLYKSHSIHLSQTQTWICVCSFQILIKCSKLNTDSLYICMKQNGFSRNIFTQSSKTTFARFKMNLVAQYTAILMINLNQCHTILSTMKTVINLYSIFTQMC